MILGRGRVRVTNDIRINPMARVGHTARCPLNIGNEDLLFTAPTGLRIPAQGDALGLRAARRCVLKERGIKVCIRRHRDHRPCGVPSERLKRVARVPRVSPWAGMQGPFGTTTCRQMPPWLYTLPRHPRTEALPPIRTLAQEIVCGSAAASLGRLRRGSKITRSAVPRKKPSTYPGNGGSRHWDFVQVASEFMAQIPAASSGGFLLVSKRRWRRSVLFR